MDDPIINWAADEPTEDYEEKEDAYDQAHSNRLNTMKSETQFILIVINLAVLSFSIIKLSFTGVSTLLAGVSGIFAVLGLVSAGFITMEDLK